MKITDKTLKRMKEKIPPDTPPEEQKAAVEKVINEWRLGVGQNLKGKVLAEFTDQFLAMLDEPGRASLENVVRDLHGAKSQFSRFRREALTAFAAIYHHGLVDGARGVTMDIPKMVDEATKKAVG